MAIRCQPCQAVLGAEVEGVDLRQVPDAATIDVLEEALERYGVLIFHAQHLTPEEQVAWSRAFGPLAMTRGTETRLPHCPEIFVVGNTIDPPVTFSPSTEHDELEWHSDNSPPGGASAGVFAVCQGGAAAGRRYALCVYVYGL